MKLFLALIIMFSAASPLKDGAALLFSKKSFTFDDTEEGVLLKHKFAFKNNGNEPLIIDTYKVSCSCTKLIFPKEPILPGQESDMTVLFDTNKKYGYQNRIIEVFSNASKKPIKIRIKVNVIPKGYH
ncbi:MAG: DUF1573 domain-containing protein [Crocinitomicaceae bacterium]